MSNMSISGEKWPCYNAVKLYFSQEHEELCGAKSNFLLQAVISQGREVVKTIVRNGANSWHFFQAKVKPINIL